MSSQSSNILDTLTDKIYNLIFSWLDSLFDDANYEKEEYKIPKSDVEKPEDPPIDEADEVNSEDVEVTGDGRQAKFSPTEEGESEGKDGFTVTVSPAEFHGDAGFMIVVTNDTTRKTAWKWLTQSEESKIKEAVEDCRKKVSATCKVCLRKITAKTGDFVQMTSITSNYDLGQAVKDVSAVMHSPEFLVQVPEGDSVYQIASDNDGYNVIQDESFEPKTSVYSDTLDCCIKTLSRIQELSWFCKGVDAPNFKNICESLIYNIQYHVSELAKLCIINGVDPVFEVCSSDAKSVPDKWESLEECGRAYIVMLKALCLASTDDERNMIQSWIRQLNDILWYQSRCLHS